MVSSPFGGIICSIELVFLLQIVDFNYHPLVKIFASFLASKSLTKTNLRITNLFDN